MVLGCRIAKIQIQLIELVFLLAPEIFVGVFFAQIELEHLRLCDLNERLVAASQSGCGEELL
jgi:hypothetical protein